MRCEGEDRPLKTPSSPRRASTPPRAGGSPPPLADGTPVRTKRQQQQQQRGRSLPCCVSQPPTQPKPNPEPEPEPEPGLPLLEEAAPAEKAETPSSAASPLSSPAYRCVRRSTILEGFEMSSRRVGVLETGQLIVAEEARHNGKTFRLRFSGGGGSGDRGERYSQLGGWVSQRADGQICLETADLYRCVKKSQIRAGFEMGSEKSGVLSVGAVITALEIRSNGTTMRVRCKDGWVSERAQDGQVCLEPRRAASLLESLSPDAGSSTDEAPVGDEFGDVQEQDTPARNLSLSPGPRESQPLVISPAATTPNDSPVSLQDTLSPSPRDEHGLSAINQVMADLDDQMSMLTDKLGQLGAERSAKEAPDGIETTVQPEAAVRTDEPSGTEIQHTAQHAPASAERTNSSHGAPRHGVVDSQSHREIVNPTEEGRRRSGNPSPMDLNGQAAGPVSALIRALSSVAPGSSADSNEDTGVSAGTTQPEDPTNLQLAQAQAVLTGVLGTADSLTQEESRSTRSQPRRPSDLSPPDESSPAVEALRQEISLLKRDKTELEARLERMERDTATRLSQIKQDFKHRETQVPPEAVTSIISVHRPD
jgi:hypothetical protein